MASKEALLVMTDMARVEGWLPAKAQLPQEFQAGANTLLGKLGEALVHYEGELTDVLDIRNDKKKDCVLGIKLGRDERNAAEVHFQGETGRFRITVWKNDTPESEDVDGLYYDFSINAWLSSVPDLLRSSASGQTLTKHPVLVLRDVLFE